MKTSQKGFIAPLLLALIAVLLIGGGAYVYVQNKPASQFATTQTSDWKTYTNSQYGFEFKYPSSILGTPSVTEANKGYIQIIFPNLSDKKDIYNPNLKSGEILAPVLEIYIIDKSITDYPYPDYGENSGTGFYKIDLSGHTAYRAKGGEGSGFGNFVDELKIDNGSLTIQMNTRKVISCGHAGPCAIPLQDEQTTQLFNQILSTFKFIPSVTATSTVKNLDSQTSSGTPVTLTTGDICSPLLKDASTLLFTDNSNKTWTVDYRNASFNKYSHSTGVVQGTDGLVKTTLQDWLKSLYRVGQPQAEICGAPGKITITGTLTGGIVLASHIELSGQ